MAKEKNNKSLTIFSFIKILLFSIIVSGTFSYGAYMWFMTGYIHKVTLNDMLLILISTFGLLSTIVFVFIGIGISSNLLIKRVEKDFDKYKTFTDSLHTTSDVNIIYENLFNSISSTYPQLRISIYYKTKNAVDDMFWKKITNQKIPLCTMKDTLCPVIVNGTNCYVHNINEDITCAYQSSDYKEGSYMCLYIKIGGHVNAILQMYDRRKYFFTPEVLSNLSAYIDVINPVLESKKALKELNKKSNTDKLTKVYNRTYLEEKLKQLLDDARNSKRIISLIIIDIDFFKKANDTYGHLAGDKLLQIFAKIIMQCIRKTDILSRYGGEEFVVILPDADLTLTKTIAERIRSTVEKTNMPMFQGKKLPSITCSLGLSTFPSLARTKEELLKSADLALYSAKNSGRNTFKVYSKKDT